VARSCRWSHAVRRVDPWLAGILLLGLGLRLIHLDAPLTDQQAWRQTDTAAIARNYCEEGLDLLYPRVDWRGATPGYVETNFPLYPFAVALLYRLAGAPAEWIGRLLSALLSTAAAFLLYGLARRLHPDPQVARLGAFVFLISPMSLFFGRAFMPEAAMLLLSVATLLTFDRWLDSQRSADLSLAVVTAALCFLVKIPTLYLGFPLVALAWTRWGYGAVRRPVLWLYLILVLLPAILWYAHAAGLFARTGLTFGIWGRAGYDKWSHQLLLGGDFYLLMGRRLVHVVFTPVGALLLVLGVAAGWPSRESRGAGSERREGPAQAREWIPHVWLGALVLYLVLIPEGNRKLHYYQLPLALPGSLLAAIPLAALLGDTRPRRLTWLWAWIRRQRPAWRQVAVALLLAAMAAQSARAVGDYYRPADELYDYYRTGHTAGAMLDARLPADALLVVGDLDDNAGAPFRAQSPTMLYYCHRRGWQITPDQFNAALLDSLASLGARYFVVPGGLVSGHPEFWQSLLRRGVSNPLAYPRFTTSEAELKKMTRQQQGNERFVLVIPLGADNLDGDTRVPVAP